MLSFHVKFVQTDGWTDRRTTVKQYARDLSIRGNKKSIVNFNIIRQELTIQEVPEGSLYLSE